jgi:transposase-like protein
MNRPALPTDDEVRTAAEQLLTDHRDGGVFPSVTALANQFGVNRTTFYRHFAAITDTMLDAAGQQHTDGPKRRRPPRQTTEPEQALRRLRTENEDLRRHLEIYEEQLRMLTTENKRLRELIEEQAAVTAIRPRTGSSRGAEPCTPSSTQHP